MLWYTFHGRDGEGIPAGATHVRVHESVKVIPANAFQDHPNIVEVELHDGVKIIEEKAFFRCFSLRRVEMPGVKWTELLLKTDPVAAMEA
jgi:hypothetical protein